MLKVLNWLKGGKIILGGNPGVFTKFQGIPGATMTRSGKMIFPRSGWTIYLLMLIAEANGIEIEVPSHLKLLAKHIGEDPSKKIDYITKTDSWDHQNRAYSFAARRHGALLGIPMGGGKSKVAADLAFNRGAKNVLITCPVSVRGVWPKQLRTHTSGEWEYCIPVKGTVKDRAAEAYKAIDLAKASGRPLALIVNHETIWRDPFKDLIEEFTFDALYVDECHRGKSPEGILSKALRDMRKRFGFILGLSGTPFAHLPPDIFAQARFIDPGLFGDGWTNFKAQYVEMGGFDGKQVVGIKPETEAEFVHLCEQFLFLVTQAEVDAAGDVPEMLPPNDIICDMTPPLWKEYRRMQKEFIAFVQGGQANAQNVLVKLTRLAQICAGHIKLDDGRVVTIGTHKADALIDRLQDIEPPVVVGCRFTEDLKLVEQVASKLGLVYHEVSGSRKELTPDATMRPDTDIMGCQIAAGSLGIDLTRARHGILFSTDFNLVNYDQFIKRFHRPGQKRKTVFDRIIVGGGSADEHILKALTYRRGVNEMTSSMIMGK